jgi:serine/threonine protein kinase
MVPGVGDEFGPYKILGPLGVGGMGMVFRAQDMRLHREVAVKVLADHLNVPSMKERFLREARAASALNHPNICTLFDIGEQSGTPYLVMELLHGDTIKHLCAGNPLPPELILEYGSQAADALAAAHARGVVHRDIKSANIFVVQQDHGTTQVKILDFGLAKMDSGDTMVTSSGQLMATSLDQGLTSPGSTVGTVAYMSPEQAKGEPLDPRTDIFSLGSVLYEMATGGLPFPGATSALVFVGLLSKDPISIRATVPGFPPELERIIFHCLAKERGDRYQTARELRQDLLRLTARESSGSHAVASAAIQPAAPSAGGSPGSGAVLAASSVNQTVISPPPEPAPASAVTASSSSVVEPETYTVPSAETSRDFMRSGLSRPAEPQTGRARNQQRESPFVHAEDLDSMVSIPVAKIPVDVSSGSVSIPVPPKQKRASAPPASPQQSSTRVPVASSYSAEEEKPKNNAGMMIGIVALLLLAVGGFAYYHFASSNHSAVEEATVASPEAPAANATAAQVRELFNEGHLNKALAAARGVAAADPKSPVGFALQQEALDRTDEFEAARQMYKSAVTAGADKSAAVHSEELLTSRLLNDSVGEQSQVAWSSSSPDGYLVTIADGYALQDAGKLPAASSAWQEGARKASLAGNSAAAAAALSSNALANALSGNCGTVSGQAGAATKLQSSPLVLANSGIALGLCHSSEAAEMLEALSKAEASNPLADKLYVPEVKAAVAIGQNNGAAALQSLQGVAQYDLGSLAPYLRGLADLQTKQPKLAVGDFKSVIEHRGAFVSGRLLCYPLALAQLSRTYAQMGDQMNAARIANQLKNY